MIIEPVSHLLLIGGSVGSARSPVDSGGDRRGREKGDSDIRRLVLVIALAATMVMAIAGTALAGEVNGSKNGRDGSWAIPAPSHAASACVYSGLEDSEMDGVVPGAHGVVQNWGHSKDATFILDSVGASYVEFDGEAFGLPTGTIVVEGCHPHLGLDGEG
jgi:hypothetical protein